MHAGTYAHGKAGARTRIWRHRRSEPAQIFTSRLLLLGASGRLSRAICCRFVCAEPNAAASLNGSSSASLSILAAFARHRVSTSDDA
ncbi:hypothetical protein MTO96_029163 [Rhipicephalus appendiculatus]